MIIEKGVLDASLHKDRMRLVKEYARLGFKQANNGNEQGFEELWRDTFLTGESQTLPLARKTLALVPPQTPPE
jgi:hypothetical protein